MAVAALAIAGFVLETVLAGHSTSPIAAPAPAPDLGAAFGANLETPTTAAGPICPAPRETTAQATNDLMSLLMPTPSGYTQAPDNQGSAGPISLDHLTQSMINPSLAQSALTSDGYEVGYRRIWDDAPAGTELHVLLFKYSCKFGAGDDASTASNPTVLGLPATTDLNVTGIPYAWGAGTVSPDQHGIYQQVIIASEGPYEMRVYLLSSHQLDGSQVLALAQAQFNVLFAKESY